MAMTACNADRSDVGVEIVVRGLRTANSPDDVMSMLSKFNLTTVVKKCAQLVSDKADYILNIFFKYPKQTLFLFLTDGNFVTRKAALELTRSLPPDAPELRFLHSQLMEFLLDTPNVGDASDPNVGHLIHPFKFLRSLTATLSLFTADTFQALLAVFERLTKNQRKPIYYNVIQCIKLMSRFNPFFLHSIFSSFYHAAFLMVSSDLWGHPEKIFIRLRRFIPFLTVSEMHVIIAHSTFQLIMKHLPNSTKPECFKLFVQRLASFTDDGVCQSTLKDTLGDLRTMDTKLKFLQAGLLKLDFSETQSILKFIAKSFDAKTDPWGSEKTIVDNFELAIQYSIYLFNDPRFRGRLDPFDKSVYGAPMTFLYEEKNGKLVDLVAEFLVTLCKSYGEDLRKVVLDHLKNLFLSGNDLARLKDKTLILLCKVVVETADNIAEELAEVFVQAVTKAPQGNWTKSLLQVLPDDVPNWARQFLVNSTAFLKWGQGDSDLDICRKVIPGLSLEQAKGFLVGQYTGEGPQSSKEWKIVGLLFQSFPANREELFELFPEKVRPGNLSEATEKYLDAIYLQSHSKKHLHS
jgi:hypothetical protein